MRVTVLGAGYMGSAMATVAAMRGHEVALWGTWLDDSFHDALDRGDLHPRLQLPLHGVRRHRAPDIAAALAGAEIVVHAVSSEGALAVLGHAAPYVPDVPVLSVSKGLLETRGGRMDRIDVVANETIAHLHGHVRAPLRFVHAAGPAKAMELARGVLTWMVFAGAPGDASRPNGPGGKSDAELCAQVMGGGHLHVETSDDLAGAELCSALKNAYATGLGLWDGYVGVGDAHNARAACFTQAIVEMRRLVVAGGGRAETVHGAAGVGDLHVTAAGGRNRAFGERVGRGKPASEVAAEMLATGELTEGYRAIATAWRFARERGVPGQELPLLEALHAIVWAGRAVPEVLGGLRLS